MRHQIHPIGHCTILHLSLKPHMSIPGVPPLMLHDLDRLFQHSSSSEPQLHLDRCLEQDEHGLWWPGEGHQEYTDSLMLQPIRKHPVALNYSDDHMQLMSRQNSAGSNSSFSQLVSEYSIRAGDELNNREMNYLQNLFAQDNFVLDLQTPLYKTIPRCHESEDETEYSTSPASSPELKPQDHPIKSKNLTFVSATGKVKMICEVQGCSKVAQSRKRCKRHGGGPRCRYPGCTKSSQGKGRCRTHGGGKQCSVEGCTSGAQQRGFCSRHGGAKLCSVDGCERHSRGNGMCAFHGGGKRCNVVDCNRSSRIQGMCAMHKRMSSNGAHLQQKIQ